MSRRELLISAPRASRVNGAHRVAADVAGEELWWESSDVELAARPEAFASPLLFPALTRGLRLASEAPLDAAWLANVERAVALGQRWWELPPLVPAGPVRGAARPARERRGLCLSCGVDSFHNALTGPAPDDLVFVQGFDVTITDQARAERVAASVRAVAEHLGGRAVVVRTNLNRHPTNDWAVPGGKRGGRLAGVAHALAGQVGGLVVSASYPDERELPHSIHRDLTPLWSSSDVALVYAGGQLWRSDKLREIADHPLVRQHLRVCPQRDLDRANCSRCKKCVLTMLVLAERGRLAGYPVFDGGGDDLPDRVLGIRRLSEPEIPVFEHLHRHELPRDVDAVLGELIDRSRNWSTPNPVRKRIRRLRRRGARRLRRTRRAAADARRTWPRRARHARRRAYRRARRRARALRARAGRVRPPGA